MRETILRIQAQVLTEIQKLALFHVDSELFTSVLDILTDNLMNILQEIDDYKEK